MATGRDPDPKFEPDVERAIELDERMLSSLKGSLATVRAEAEAVAERGLADALARIHDRFQPGRGARPVVWAFYADLCHAIALDDVACATAAAQALSAALDAAPAPYVSNLDDRDLGVGYAAVYGRALDDDRDRPLDLVAVDAHEAARARALIRDARDLIGGTSPALLSEMDALVREIVLVGGRSGGNDFAGAATLFLWGAIFINPTRIGSPWPRL